MLKNTLITVLSICGLFLMTSCVSHYQMLIWHKGTKAEDKNFKFYGKVIDDLGQPVPNAIVKISVGHYDPFAEYLRSSRIREPKTDSQGLFELSDKGSNFSIENIYRYGYEYTYDKNRKNHSFNLHRRAVGEKELKFEKTDPIIYHLRKRGELAYMYTNSFAWHFKSNDNKPVKFAILDKWIDDDGFWHGKERPYSKIIDMSCVFSDDLLQYEIKFEYLGENGGIIANDQALYEAPIEGYTKSVTLKGDMIGGYWHHDATPTTPERNTPHGKQDEMWYLYVKADGGKYHSRIELKMDTQPDKGRSEEPYCQARVAGKIFTNPDGTLSLEYDPEYVRKEDAQRRYVFDRRKKAKLKAALKKQTFDEDAFIKQIRQEEMAEKKASLK